MPDAGKPRDIEDRAFRFACRILRYCEPLMRRGGVAALVGRQLAESGTSIGANLEEAAGGQTKPDFIAKLFVSLKEARESYYWLRLAEAALSPVPPDTVSLKQESRELLAIVTTIAKNAKGGGMKH